MKKQLISLIDEMSETQIIYAFTLLSRILGKGLAKEGEANA